MDRTSLDAYYIIYTQRLIWTCLDANQWWNQESGKNEGIKRYSTVGTAVQCSWCVFACCQLFDYVCWIMPRTPTDRGFPTPVAQQQSESRPGTATQRHKPANLAVNLRGKERPARWEENILLFVFNSRVLHTASTCDGPVLVSNLVVWDPCSRTYMKLYWILKGLI